MSLTALFSSIPASLTDRLGWCALHFLWQGAAIGAGLQLLLLICRRGTAELRHALCGVALLLMAAAPVITWQYLPVPVNAGPRTLTLPEAVTVTDFPDGADLSGLENPQLDVMAGHPALRPGTGLFIEDESAIYGRTSKRETASAPLWQHWLGGLWLGGAALMGVWRLCGLWGTFRLIHRAERAAGALLNQVERMARNCGLRRAPLVKITGRLISPAVAGVLRPVLLLPASALAGLSPRELDFVLAHEFAHLRRQDFLTGLLQSLAETVLFFHPAVWWVSRRMSFEREQACDDAAMRITGNRRAGAQALARLAELQLQHTAALAPAAGGGQILARVQRLLEPGRPPQRVQAAAVLPLLLMAAAAPFLLVPQRAESQTPLPFTQASTDPPAQTTNSKKSQPAESTLKPEDSPAPRPDASSNQAPETAAPAVNAAVPVMRGTITDRNGVVLAESIRKDLPDAGETGANEIRQYPLGASASHVLGYAALNRREETTQNRSKAGSRAEKSKTVQTKVLSGVEKTLDDALQAVPASDGKAQPAAALTLDARIQRISENALRDAGIGRGAAVVLDVANGDILAMASVPDFDPNQMVPFGEQSDWSELNSDATQPLMNRALAGRPPGSTFKLVTSIAAGDSDQWRKSFNCSGTVTYGGRPFACWTVKQHVAPHGTLGLSDALKCSCNCWFYQAGNAAGIDSIVTVAGKLGIGLPSNSGLDQSINTSFMPSPAWWTTQNGGPWTSAKTANAAIGQGEVQATPLQMATVAAAVANDGKIWKQHIVSKSLVKGEWQSPTAELEHDLLAEGTPAETLEAIREGMWKTVNDEGATGKLARSSLITMAGKTGTAQAWRVKPGSKQWIGDNHTWFIGFAPFEKPRFAFAILVANGKAGGSTSAPIAKRIMESVELMNRGKLNVDLSPLAVAKGNFNFVESVEYKEPLPAE
ncbi:MAG: hypothetical protein JWM59_1570 [Verrucomicrobiales bacterium]|nr:hypothetical protein [Verrucomicrobiales bacterium]